MKRVEYLILCSRFPLLGFRLTVAIDGRAKIGPTALPASWREQYGGLRNFRVGELAEIRGWETHLFVLDASFRKLAAEAIRKHSRRELIRLAGALAEAIRFEVLHRVGKARNPCSTSRYRHEQAGDGFRHRTRRPFPARSQYGLAGVHVRAALCQHVCDIILSNKCVAYTPSPTVR